MAEENIAPKEISDKEKTTKKARGYFKKELIPIYGCILLAILLLISIFTSGFSYSTESVPDEMLKFVNKYLLPPGTSATLKYVTTESGLYAINVSVQGNEYKFYATKDGKYFIPQVVDVDNVKKTTNKEAPEQKRVQVSADDDPVKGSKNAPVTIIEFSDFQCPFCGKFHNETLPLIEENYIKTGKVKFVYRDFPLDFHENAQKAAEAAECADEQGKFWEYHDKLFNNQRALGIANLKQYAKDLGLNVTAFDSCLDSGKMAAEVKKDLQDGQSYGVTGTPAFFINGIHVSGAQPYSVFKEIIDAEIANKG